MNSIRQRAVLMTSSAVAAFLVLLCTGSYFFARQKLITNFDNELLADFYSVVAVTLVWPTGEVWVDLNSDILVEYSAEGDKFYEVRSADGLKSLDRSPLLEQKGIHIDHPFRAIQGSPLLFDIQLPNDQQARVALQTVPARWGWFATDPDLRVSEQVKNTKVEVLVARDRQPLDSNLTSLLIWLGTLLLVIPLWVFGVVYLSVGRSLVSLKRLTSKLEDIKSTDERASLKQDWPVELVPVVSTVNHLLNRLQQHFDRERRFTASVAHELRTPITELQLATDVALQASEQPDRLYNAVTQANALAHRMGNLVNGLSTLTHHQRKEQNLNYGVCDLIRIIDEELLANETVKVERNLTITKTLPKSYFLHTDVTILQSIVCNLLKNALAHAPEDTEIKIYFKVGNINSGEAVLRIANIAPQISSNDPSHLFDPFWRKNTSHAGGEHFGLGLAIAKEAAQLLGFTLMARKLNHEVIEFSLYIQQQPTM